MTTPVRPPSIRCGLIVFRDAVKSLPVISLSMLITAWPGPGAICVWHFVTKELLHL